MRLFFSFATMLPSQEMGKAGVFPRLRRHFVLGACIQPFFAQPASLSISFQGPKNPILQFITVCQKHCPTSPHPVAIFWDQRAWKTNKTNRDNGKNTIWTLATNCANLPLEFVFLERQKIPISWVTGTPRNTFNAGPTDKLR